MNLKTLVCLSLITLVASLSPTAWAQVFTVIHNFTGADGAFPEGVTLRGGNLYGVTAGNNQSSKGSVFETQHGSNWVTSLIFPFFDIPHGRYPGYRVYFGPDGHLYGNTIQGGTYNFGIVYDLVPPLTICKTPCYWKENIQYSFTGGSDGNAPSGDLAWDQQGNMYGSARAGGISDGGTVYELIRTGNGWTEGTLHRFVPPEGVYPYGGVIFDSNGNLFGTTYSGGSGNAGTVFELKYSAGIGWAETTIYNFQNGSDGGAPIAGLTSDSAGNFYGATRDGGNNRGGTVFELTPAGDSYRFQVLYTFPNIFGMACGPAASLTVDAGGNLYGTRYCGGSNNLGSVFKLTNTENGWSYLSLHDFTGTDGQYPTSNVVIDANGNLYGAASGGGSQNWGVLWMIAP